MAELFSSTLTTTSVSDEAIINNPDKGITPYQMLCASGPFGGGTLTWQLTIDGGTTWNTLATPAGAATMTGASNLKTEILGAGNNLGQVKIRASFAAVGAATVLVKAFDCR